MLIRPRGRIDASSSSMGSSSSRRRMEGAPPSFGGGGGARLLVMAVATLLLLWAPASEAFHRIPDVHSAVHKPSARPASAATRLGARRKGVDHYNVLGLQPGATPEEVKRAYRERAKSTHPDASRTTETVHEFMRVKEAYETLYDAQRRAEFDRKRKVAEVTELAASVTEILATDLAIPLARDVALPLIKASIRTLDRTVIQQWASPFLRRTVDEARVAMDTLRQASEDRVTYFNKLQAAWRAEEIKQLSAQLEEATRNAKLAQDAALAAAESLAKAADAEQLSRARLEEERRMGEEIAQRTAALSQASASALTRFQEKAQAEEAAKLRVRRGKGERRRLYMEAKSAEASVRASQAELEEAEEALRRAQARALKAREAHGQAVETLSRSQLAMAAVAEELNASTAALEAAAAAVEPERAAWEGLQEEERALQRAYFKHTKAERALRLEVGNAVRRREGTARELERAKGDTAQYQNKVLELATAIERKYNEAQTGSGIGASSGATATASKPTTREQQKESFEAVMGGNKATKGDKAGAPRESQMEASVFAAAKETTGPKETEEAAKRQQLKEEWVRQQQDLLHEDLRRASEAAAAVGAREEAVLSSMGV